MKRNSRFYILSTGRTEFEVHESLEHLPIIWNRFGEYRVMPREVIENVINVMKMYTISDGKRTHPTPIILWSQGIPISNLAGRALVGE